MTPGLTALTRMPLPFKSTAQLRANERIAALGGAVDAEGRASLNGNQRGVQDNRAARGPSEAMRPEP